jgi:hypothetical protein
MDNQESNQTDLKNIQVLLIALFVAIVLLLTSNIFFLNRLTMQHTIDEEKINEVNNLITSQRWIIEDLVLDYEESAYNNPGIDRIAEQQLIVSEYTLTALQVIALQNTQIMDLLVNY